VAIVGIGIDVVNVERFQRALHRAPRLADRLFGPAEGAAAARDVAEQSLVGTTVAVRSLAARFAAKEAVVKALAVNYGICWHDVELKTSENGAPKIRVAGALADRAAQLGVNRWHVSLAHDGDIATAMVIAEQIRDG